MEKEGKRPMRAILVDDYPPLLAALTTLLRTYDGIEIVGRAHTGGDGLKLAEEQQPDLVLVDFSMPDMNGAVVTRKLKARAAPPKVVVMSFHAEPEYRDMAMDAGADAYLVKSDLYQELMPLLRRIAG
jgi:DNA-binding NarL/FixJ family response regulator